MKGAFNCAAVLDKLNKNPSAGKWSKIIFDAMRSCADKSVPKKNLRDVWKELSLPIHGAPWNGDAVRTSKSLSAASLCVVSGEQFDFKIYYINEKEASPKYRMIKDIDVIDDISKLKLDKDEKEVYLVPELNNLHDFFFKVIGSGYEPKITFQAGIITEMRLRLKKVNT